LTLMMVPAVMIAVAVLPWLLADPDGVRNSFGYAGVPGGAGLTLLVQPAISTAYLEQNFGGLGDLNGTAFFLYEHGALLTLSGLALLAAFLARVRPAPLDGAVLLWLTVWVFMPSWSFQYAIWGLPFMIMAGYLRGALLFQAWMVLPIVFWYDAFGLMSEGGGIYPWIMGAFWFGWVIALALLGRRIVLARREQPDGVLEPLVGYGPGGAPTSAL
jgi:hypothetical protein